MKVINFILLLITSINIQASTPRHINKSLSEWLAQALKLQREMDINAPLNETTFLATHNSYNSAAYAIPLARYVDPNQTLTIYDQLEAGVRSIELDTHWTLNYKFTHDILLCHGEPNHLGCGMLGLPVSDGLNEIKSWLGTHPNEIILLYLERHLDGHEPQMAAALEVTLGQYLYKPSSSTLNKETPSCTSLPTTISKADILRAGKQVLVVADGCDDQSTIYQDQATFPYNWNDYVFAGTGDAAPSLFNLLESTMNNFTDYPDCNKETTFAVDQQHTNLWRVYEDRTKLSNVIYTQRPLLAEDLPSLMNCGINWIAMDMLEIDDPRLAASIWSWAPTYPQKNKGTCAIYQRNVGIKNIPCTESIASYACQNKTTHLFQAYPTTGTAADGERICQQLGSDWHFSTPINATYLTTLKNSLTELGIEFSWLNYKEVNATEWSANSLGYA